MRLLGTAVVVLLTVWAAYFSLGPLHGLFWLTPGEFDVRADSSMRVTEVDSGGAAERAGIRVGDRFAPTTSFENRLYLQYVRNPKPGQTIALRTENERGSRTVEITAKPGVFDAQAVGYYFASAVINLIFVLVGASLVLLRPSRMTWAFFIFSVGAGPAFVLGHYWLPSSVVFANGVFAGMLRSVGLGAFLVFCVRVPGDRAVGSWRYLESVGALVVIAILLLCSAAADLSIVGTLHVESFVLPFGAIVEDAIYLIGMVALTATFVRERGADRLRVAVIIGGLVIGLGARVVGRLIDPGANIYTGDDLSDTEARWLVVAWFVAGMLQVAIPLSVAYAVVRYHALNLGLVANRTLVYGLFLCAGFAVFGLFDFLLTKQFARNQFEVGLDIAIALTIGLSFQFWHPRAIRLIDRLFLPDRYRATVALDALSESLGVTRSDDAPDRTVETVAAELRLSSLAVFKKTPDGGFVRYAAAGWPKGSAWHVYAVDPLARSFGDRARVRFIDEAQTAGINVPAEPNRPRVGMLLSPQTPGESLILVGAHLGGRRPDQDEVRGIASLLREFARTGDERVGGLSPATAQRSFP